MYKVVLVDDETHAQDLLSKMIHHVFPGKYDIIASCHSVDEALEKIRIEQPDILFLDVNMPQKNGFDLLDELGSFDFEVIFTTAHDDHAIRAIKHDAFDYLLKPIEILELKSALIKFETKQEEAAMSSKLDQVIQQKKNNDLIKFTTQEFEHFLHKDEILYIKGIQNYAEIYLDNGKKILISKNLKSIEEHLADDRFIRVHQSYLVNGKFIDRYDKKHNFLHLKNDEKISVSIRMKANIFKYFE